MKTKNNIFKAALAAACIAGATSATRADLTINGAVGLPLNPTAQMPGQGSVRVQANFNDLGNINGNDVNLGGIYAAGRLGDRLEINGGLERINGDQFLNPFDKTNIAVGAKYLLTRETDTGVRLAVGAGHSRALRNTHVYGVATKSLGTPGLTGRAPITGHLGVRYDNFDPTLVLVDDSNQVSVYGGVEVPVTRTGNLSLVGELQSKNASFGTSAMPYSASVRYRPGSGFSASGGVMREGISGESGVFAQIGKTF